MNIALVSMNANPLLRLGADAGGGQAVQIDGLARALSLLGNRVTIYARRDDPTLPGRLVAAAHVGVEFIEAGPLRRLGSAEVRAWIPAFAAGLAAAWKQRLDVVHAYGWESARAVVAAGVAVCAPIVATFDGSTLPASEVAAMRDAVERAIATSSTQVFSLMERGFSPGAIALVPPGVDVAAFTPQAPVAYPSMRVVTLSRLVPDEGVADVIEAVASLEGVALTIGGGQYGRRGIAADPDVMRLEALAHERRATARVAFAGRLERDTVPAFLRAADVVVCAPHGACLGNVALEAMACGIPVIVSAVGGLADAVADGMTGLHVAAGAPRQIAYAIDALRSDPQRRMRLGRLGVERTATRNRWSRIAAATAEHYRNVVARTSRVSAGRA